MSAVKTPGPLSAESLLAAARQLATGHSGLGATAYRAAALLGRSALEEAIWSLFPQLSQISGRAMLITLNGVPNVSVQLSRRATAAWGRLSGMSHHHAYEMPPTVDELVLELDAVQTVIDGIRERQGARAQSG